jgi:hypothetical protein
MLLTATFRPVAVPRQYVSMATVVMYITMLPYTTVHFIIIIIYLLSLPSAAVGRGFAAMEKYLIQAVTLEISGLKNAG